MPASDKQLAANRRNARKSTGPRTLAGKDASSRNALTHGIRAHDLVINDSVERVEDFEALRSALVDELRPASPLEELLVDRIATLHWRARRVLRAEAGAIRVAVSDAVTQSVEAQRDTLDRSLRALDGIGGGDNIYGNAIAANLREQIDSCAMGQMLLIQYLRKAQSALQAGDELSPDLRRRLIDFVGPDSEPAILLALPSFDPALIGALSSPDAAASVLDHAQTPGPNPAQRPKTPQLTT